MDETITVAAPTYVPPTEEKKAFLKAFAAAQGEFLPVLREREVIIAGKDGKPGYKFQYAELAVIIDACRPALAKNGLSLRSKITPGPEAGTVWLTSILGHAEGYEDVSELLVQIAGDLKTFGGQLTYLRRYIQGPHLGVASEDDMDGNGEGAGEGGNSNGVAGHGTRPPPPAPRAPQRRSQAPAAPAAPAAPTAPAPAPTGEKMATAAQIKWLQDRAEGEADGAATDALLTAAGITDLKGPYTEAAWKIAREKMAG